MGKWSRMIKVHVNPLKPKILMVVNSATGSIKAVEEAMSWRDAAIVASVLTAASFFTVFLTGLSYADVVANPGLCAYNSVVFIGKEWFTIFIGLAGLGKISERLRTSRQAQGSPGPTAKTTPEG